MANEYECGDSVEDGMVTVEAAIGLTGLIAVLALVIGALSVSGTHAQLCQAVREGARAQALGTSAEQAVTSHFRRSVAVRVGGDQEWVKVTATTGAITIGTLPIGSLSCTAETLREPGGYGEK